MFDTIYDNLTVTTDLSIGIGPVLITIAVAMVLGLLISAAYIIITPRHIRSASFTMSIIILPAIVAVVVVLIGGNLARAFSMAGIFTLVRFRSIPGDSKDITLIFITMAIGLSLGLGYLTLSAVIAVIFVAAVILISKSGFGVSKQKEKLLKIVIPEDMNYQDAFNDLFEKYTNSCNIQKVKTTNMGTLFELQYHVTMKMGSSEKEFIDAIRCRNGNLSIQLGIKESGGQQL